MTLSTIGQRSLSTIFEPDPGRADPQHRAERDRAGESEPPGTRPLVRRSLERGAGIRRNPDGGTPGVLGRCAGQAIRHLYEDPLCPREGPAGGRGRTGTPLGRRRVPQAGGIPEGRLQASDHHDQRLWRRICS